MSKSTKKQEALQGEPLFVGMHSSQPGVASRLPVKVRLQPCCSSCSLSCHTMGSQFVGICCVPESHRGCTYASTHIVVGRSGAILACAALAQRCSGSLGCSLLISLKPEQARQVMLDSPGSPAGPYQRARCTTIPQDQPGQVPGSQLHQGVDSATLSCLHYLPATPPPRLDSTDHQFAQSIAASAPLRSRLRLSPHGPAQQFEIPAARGRLKLCVSSLC
jgi:hypothetical protein